jgi:hypothetical protein
MKLIDLSGETVGRWTVIRRNPENYRGTFARWDCKCSCGTERTVLANHLLMKRSLSCGCLHSEQLSQRQITHGQSRRSGDTGSYRVWKHMLQRCENPKCKDFPYYGGRGIGVCERWHDFVLFFADMGEKPDGLSIDRIENNIGYQPGNCRWATMREQNANKRGKFTCRSAA